MPDRSRFISLPNAEILEEPGLTRWVRRNAPAASVPARDTLSKLDDVLQSVATPVPDAAPVVVPSAVPAVQPGASVPPAEDLSAMDWDALEAALRRRPLREGSRQAVFGIGVRTARLLVVGEAPGADEDRSGEPFVGRAGQLLDRMLAAIGYARAPQAEQQGCYIANVCKFRPPNNRDPLPEEVAADLPFLLRQIELVSPDVILAVGRVAAQNLLDSQESLGKLRQRQHVFAGRPLAVTYHPAYLLRQPAEKARAWEDLKKVRTLLATAE